MGSRGSYITFLWIGFLVLSQLLIITGLYNGSVDREFLELQLRRNGVRTRGIVTLELDAWPKDGRQWFEIEYYVDDRPYLAMFSTSSEHEANQHRLDANSRKGYEEQGIRYKPHGPDIYIIYNKDNPYSHIVGELSGDVPWSLMAYCFTLISMLTIILYSIIQLIRISHVVNNGRRVLVELVAVKHGRYPSISAIKCRWVEEYHKVYKGDCRFYIEHLMQENDIKYIPMYVMPNYINRYFIDCHEMKKIIKYKGYNRHTPDELQDTNHIMVLPPKTPWFSYMEVKWEERIAKVPLRTNCI